MEVKSRTVTLPGLASPGPHPGARPGVGARRRALGGRVFACGTWPGTARRKDVGPPSRRPTTRRKEHKGPVQCVLGCSHGRGPQRPKPWTKNLAFGTWNVTSLGWKEPELVREVERYRLEIVGLASTHSLGSGTQLLEGGWTIFFSGVPHDLEKAYDRVPREELWYCMRKSGVAEKYVRVVQDMYERSRTVVRCAVGQTEEFNVEVGLHQGSALSPFLFAIVMDQLSEEVRQESPWTMMFADDIVICSESREQVEENLERWRFALERRGMKVSRSKTEYMCVNEREGSGTVRLQGEEVKKVQEFKYLGSTVQSNGECGKEVKKRVQAGWNGWRKVSGVLCDQKISARIKGKVYRTVGRPAMLYGLETVSLRKRQESELEVAELKMLRFSLGVTRLDRIRNEYIRGTAHVGRLGDKVREARLRWFGHVQRRERLEQQPMTSQETDSSPKLYTVAYP
ncbi:hypothetical protein QTP86_002967 [Hemibagrus guttatus]|nr:hypothetical protein QTP86_002967 [Hemibagrus guttatus]